MKNSKIIKKIRKAFTLVEVILAIFILEIGLLGIAGFYAYSFQITKIARNETTAANLAQGVLDEQIAKNYDDPTLMPTPGGGTKIAYSDDPAFANFKKQVDIAYIDSNLAVQTTDTHMKKIVVTIYWQEVGGEESFQTASIKAEH